MRLIVYVDVLLVLNFIVDYLLLLLSARLCGGRFSRIRLLAAALVGALLSLAIFLPELPPAANAAFKLGSSALLAAVAGGYRDGRGYLKRLFMLLAASFVFAGFLLFVTLLGGGKNGFYHNGVCYYQISGMKLLGISALAYALLTLWQKLFKRAMVEPQHCRVHITAGGRTAVVPGEMDSQNHLIDLFSGTPVVIGPCALLEPVLPEGVRRALRADFSDGGSLGGVRMIPCATVSGSGLLPAFRPDRMLLDNGEGLVEIEDVYIAVATELDSAGTGKIILNPALTGRKTQNLKLVKKGGA